MMRLACGSFRQEVNPRGRKAAVPQVCKYFWGYPWGYSTGPNKHERRKTAKVVTQSDRCRAHHPHSLISGDPLIWINENRGRR